MDKLITASELESVYQRKEAPTLPEVPGEFQIFLPLIEVYLGNDSTGHDVLHMRRVLQMGLFIHEKEGAGDRFIIGAACLLHDLMRPWEKQQKADGVPNHEIRSHFSQEAIEKIRNELQQLPAMEHSAIEPILKIIEHHENHEFPEDQDWIERQIVQDADMLDAIGALGIARALMFGGSYGDALVELGEKLTIGGFKEDPSKKGGSVVNHIYEKLLTLVEKMHTETAREMGKIRTARMLAITYFMFEELIGNP